MRRRADRYVNSLLRGRRPRRFRADENATAVLRTAIDLLSAGIGRLPPRGTYVARLRRRLGRQQTHHRPTDVRGAAGPSPPQPPG